MTIHAIIPVHNRIDLTLGFLDSLDSQELDEQIAVLIVDDGSSDGTCDRLRQRSGRLPVEIITGSGDLWWAGSMALALQHLIPRVASTDWVYFGNNDTVLEPDHLASLLATARSYPRSVVGACSIEVWPDGSRHPVSSGFLIDGDDLSISAVPGEVEGVQRVDALAARGLMIPGEALAHVRFHPRVMPQHFADVAMTSTLGRKGYLLLVDHAARSTQTDRAGSAVEWGHVHRLSLNPRDPLYAPAIAAFWWLYLTPFQRFQALPRVIARGVSARRRGRSGR